MEYIDDYRIITSDDGFFDVALVDVDGRTIRTIGPFMGRKAAEQAARAAIEEQEAA